MKWINIILIKFCCYLIDNPSLIVFILSKQMTQITSDVSHMVHLCEKLMKSKIDLNGKNGFSGNIQSVDK